VSEDNKKLWAALIIRLMMKFNRKKKAVLGLA
jgi:hypothetical protein